MLREVLGVQFSVGAWYGLWWVWMERCRDGSYAINVWVVFFGGSASLHVLFLHFLAKCFFCNLFWVMVCVVCFDLYSNQHQKGLRLHVQWGEGLLSGSAM